MLEPRNADQFKQRMMRRARESARAPKPRKEPVPLAVPPPAPTTELSVLKEILAFLGNYRADPGASSAGVSFVVTERDAKGKVRAFRVEA